MSVPNYEGKTYVGYLDISGFKEMMKDNDKVENVLDSFYSCLYRRICDVNINDNVVKINAVAVSDCAVLFLSNGERDDVDQRTGLLKMLSFINSVNREFINLGPYSFMTTCSIAYGDFSFENRKDSDHIRKNCLRGPAYVAAYLDNEKETERMKPGECRILMKGLTLEPDQQNEFALLKKESRYYRYYYWMLNNSREIPQFKRKYSKTYEEMYVKLMKLLRNPCL